MIDYYVILTGGKNNAGDFLIKYRAKNILKAFRSDREFTDLNAWEPIEGEKLELVNNSKGLILTGGPSLVHNIYGGTYKLNLDLDKIEVPIISFGIGWYSERGDWLDVDNYNFSKNSLKLLKRLSENGLFNSVRDYHTYQVMKNHGIDNVLMTGCPALYEPNNFEKDVKIKELKKINFSLGVSFSESKKMEKSVKELIIKLCDKYGKDKFNVVFHHSLDSEYLKTPNPRVKLYKKNLEFSQWLTQNQISFKDISGSAEDLIKEYEISDLHIGYRVHAHIFMSSISKPSILISEDGRGKALNGFISGCNFDGFTKRKNGIFYKVLNRLFGFDLFSIDNNLPQKVMDNIDFEIKNSLPRIKSTRKSINNHFEIMKLFLNQLP